MLEIGAFVRRILTISPFLCVIYVTNLMGQSGIISTVGGTFRGFAGDDGLAKSAAFTLANKFNDCDPATYEQTSHLTIDKAGNLYIADTNNHRIRRINPDGVVTTVIGSGLRPDIDQFCGPIGGSAAIGEGGQAKAAKLNGPTQIIFDPAGNMVVVDEQNNRIRRVNAQGVISTIVGSNLHQFYAPNTPATTTGLDWPISAAYDAQGILYFAEMHSNRVAKVGTDGRVTTVAGIGLPGTMGENVSATSGGLSKPVSIAFDTVGNLYVTEQTNNRVRKITPQGIISTYAGKGTPGFSGDGGRATNAELNLPNGIAFDSKGNLYIADMANQRVRRVTPDGIISTVAGNGNIDKAVDGAIASESPLSYPISVAVDAKDDLYIVDWLNYQIRKVSFTARPLVSSGGIVNSASFAPSPVPAAVGSIISIFGSNLAPSLTSASEVPLPTKLNGVSVAVNGKNIPMIFVSSGQINAQLPYDLPDGPASLTITNASGTSGAEPFFVGRSSPGIFQIGATGRAVVVNQDFTLNAPENPERRGNIIVAYLTGIGPVNPPVVAGEAASFLTLSYAAGEYSATIGNLDAKVLFLGLTPGFVGLAQANIEVPANAPTGPAVPLVIFVNRQPGNSPTIAIR